MEITKSYEMVPATHVGVATKGILVDRRPDSGSDDGIVELAKSILREGQLEPAEVCERQQEDGHNGRYTIVFGRRRLRAIGHLRSWAIALNAAPPAERVGMLDEYGIPDDEHADVMRWENPRIEVLVVERPTDEHAFARIVAENSHRTTPPATYYAALCEESFDLFQNKGYSVDMSVELTANTLNLTASEVRKRLRLAAAPSAVKEAVDGGDVSPSDADKLLRSGASDDVLEQEVKLLEERKKAEKAEKSKTKGLSVARRKEVLEGMRLHVASDPRIEGAFAALKAVDDLGEVPTWLAPYLVENLGA